jgi:predicted TIM-barrel fold metal-dependent hydrolase
MNIDSDWPIALLAGRDERVWEAIASILSELSRTTRAAIRGGTAERFHRIA